MAKQAFGPDKEAVEKLKKENDEMAKKPLPQLTFSEAEVQRVADFINFVYLNANFSMDMKGFKAINQKFADMHNHVSKIERYIFEHKKVSEAKKAVE